LAAGWHDCDWSTIYPYESALQSQACQLLTACLLLQATVAFVVEIQAACLQAGMTVMDDTGDEAKQPLHLSKTLHPAFKTPPLLTFGKQSMVASMMAGLLVSSICF
jgi:hypothetical protein